MLLQQFVCTHQQKKHQPKVQASDCTNMPPKPQEQPQTLYSESVVSIMSLYRDTILGMFIDTIVLFEITV